MAMLGGDNHIIIIIIIAKRLSGIIPHTAKPPTVEVWD